MDISGDYSTEQELYAAKLADVRRILASVPTPRLEDEKVSA